jgi:hypothetical protein
MQSEGFVLDDAVASHSLLFVEFLNHFVLGLYLHFRLLQQGHQLLHCILSVYFRRVFDGFSPLAKPESGHCFSFVVGGGRNIDDQTGQRVAAQTLLQKTSEFGVAVRHVSALSLGKRVNDVAQC